MRADLALRFHQPNSYKESHLQYTINSPGFHKDQQDVLRISSGMVHPGLHHLMVLPGVCQAMRQGKPALVMKMAYHTLSAMSSVATRFNPNERNAAAVSHAKVAQNDFSAISSNMQSTMFTTTRTGVCLIRCTHIMKNNTYQN